MAPASAAVHEQRTLMAGEDVAVYACYSPDGRLRPYQAAAVRQLQASGQGVVLAINQQAPDAGAPPSGCVAVVRRHNRGFDFGAWRAGLSWLRQQPAEPGRVLLLNDSVYGPLSASGWLPAADPDIDAWAAVLARWPRPHAQSWLLLLEPRPQRDVLFAWFLRQPDLRDKRAVIARQEVGLSNEMARLGMRVRPLLDRDRTADPIRFNPAQHCWRELLGVAPFVKRELVFDDPHGVGAEDVDVVLRARDMSADLVREDRQRGRR